MDLGTKINLVSVKELPTIEVVGDREDLVSIKGDSTTVLVRITTKVVGKSPTQPVTQDPKQENRFLRIILYFIMKIIIEGEVLTAVNSRDPPKVLVTELENSYRETFLLLHFIVFTN